MDDWMYERVFLIPKKPCLDDLIKTSLFFSGCFKSPYTSLQGMFCNFIKTFLTAFVFPKIFDFLRSISAWAILEIFLWVRSGGVMEAFFKSKLKAFFIGFQIFLY